MPLEVQVDISKFLRALDAAPEAGVRSMRAVMRDIGQKFTTQVLRERLRGQTSPTNVSFRTGALARSFGQSLSGSTLNQLILHMGFGPPAQPWAGTAEDYAHVHEHGATIRGVNVEHLALPGPDNLTPSGVARIQSPRDLADPRFIPWIFSDGDFGFLVFDNELLMFLLKHEVEIEPRLHFNDDWQEFQREILPLMLPGLKKMLDIIERKGR